jgi:hypothetical protein
MSIERAGSVELFSKKIRTGLFQKNAAALNTLTF